MPGIYRTTPEYDEKQRYAFEQFETLWQRGDGMAFWKACERSSEMADEKFGHIVASNDPEYLAEMANKG